MASGNKGCGCGAILLVFGILAVLGGGSVLLLGVRHDGEWDFANPFGIMDALSYDLEPIVLQPTDEGGLRLEFELVRTGPDDWTWAEFDLSHERLDVGPSVVDLKRLSPIPSEIPRSMRIVFESGPVEMTEGDELRLRMDVRIRAERFRGTSSIHIDRSFEQTLGDVGDWYDRSPVPPSDAEPIDAEPIGAEDADG